MKLDKHQAKQDVIRAALLCATDQFSDPTTMYADAQAELHDEIFREAVANYVEVHWQVDLKKP
jgi:hypothetical protein